MAFPVSAALLDAIVLAIVAREGTYGYKITQDVRQVMDISEACQPMIRPLPDESVGITKSHRMGWRNWTLIAVTGSYSAILLSRYLGGERTNECV